MQIQAERNPNLLKATTLVAFAMLNRSMEKTVRMSSTLYLFDEATTAP